MSTMSQAIAETQESESFSYSFVVNLNQSLQNQEDDFSLSFSSRFSIDEPNSFIEMDPRLPSSRRFFRVPTHELSSLHFASFESSNFEELHEDEFIYNAHLMSQNNYGSPISCLDTKQEVPYLRKAGFASLRRCRRLSKSIFLKYLDFVRPLCKRIRILHSKKISVKKCSSLSKKSMVHSMEDNCDWRRSCDSESSIYEAVLHCKRTIDAGK